MGGKIARVIYARQFVLPFPHDAVFLPNAYLRGQANEEAFQWIERPQLWPAGRLAIQGEAGVGKTHFLHVFAQLYNAAVLPAAALHMFMPVSSVRALAVDDADTIDDPRVLLHLLNTAAEQGMPTLLAGRVAPAHWAVGLPDLSSRLRAMNTAILHPLDDGLLRAILGRLLADRQLVVPERLQTHMLLHLPRTGGALREAVARLDRLALAAGRHVTRAMVARVVSRADLPVETMEVEGDDLLNQLSPA